MDTFSRVLGVFVHYTDEQVGQKAWQPHGLRLGRKLAVCSCHCCPVAAAPTLRL